MFTGFAEHTVNLLAEVAPIFPLGGDADLAQSGHPLMVLAEPSTLTLAMIGAGVMAVSYRVRRSKQWHSRSSQTKCVKKDASHIGEQPRRGAA